MSYFRSILKLKITMFLIVTALIFWLMPSNLIFAEEGQSDGEEIVSEDTSSSNEESLEEEETEEEQAEEEVEEEEEEVTEETEEEQAEEEVEEEAAEEDEAEGELVAEETEEEDEVSEDVDGEASEGEEVTEEEETAAEEVQEEASEDAVEEVVSDEETEGIEVEEDLTEILEEEETTALEELIEEIIEDITTVSTNKEDYGYGEKVIITGKNYEPNQTLIIKILRPDGTYVEMSVLTDAGGNFTYDEYSIDYAGENYLLTVSDLEGNTIDEIGFTDENIYVDPTGSDTTGKGTQTNPYQTISKAIEVAAETTEDDTIYVNPGTYEEQLIVNTNVSLFADPTGVEIKSPTEPQSGFKVAESSSKWEPIVFAYGGTDIGGIISGASIIDFIMQGFIINGMEDDPASGNRKAGILLRNVNGTIKENIIENMGLITTSSETFGIIAYGDSDLIISENEVSDYSRGGIIANGDSRTEPLYETPNVLIKNNTVTGPGLDAPVTPAPNGIQIGWGATGKIVENTVSGNGWPGTAWTGSGIIIAGSDNIEVDNNIVIQNESGIVICGDMWTGGLVADGTWIHNNTVDENTYGISIQDKSNNTIIENNTIKNSSYDGIGISDFYGNAPTGTVILSNTIIGNNNENDATSGGIWIDSTIDGNEVKINFNSIVDNNKFGILNTSTVGTLDATNNWWGDVSGPSGEGYGTGDAVSSNVDYDPWLNAFGNPINFEAVQSFEGNTFEDKEMGVGVNVDGGAPVVTVGKYSTNPGSGFANDLGMYTDLHIDDATGVNQIVYRMYYTDADVAAAGLVESSLRARYWNGNNWVECSNQTVNTAGNYIEVTITSTTKPSLADLVGTAFAAGGSTPAGVTPPASVSKSIEIVEETASPAVIEVLGISELPFTGLNPIIPISGMLIIIGGLAMVIASLKKKRSMI